jgi:hypothetical protein
VIFGNRIQKVAFYSNFESMWGLMKDDRRILDHFATSGFIVGKIFRVLSFFSSLKIFNRVPVLGQIMSSIRGLRAGHESEIDLNIPPLFVNLDQTSGLVIPKNVDVVIIGSGPGAAMAALSFSKNRENVLVIERGTESITPNIYQHSLAHVRSDFYSAGQEAIISTTPAIFAQANVLGGGSEVNSGLYHRTPSTVASCYLKEWNIDKIEWEDAQNYVENILDCSTQDVNRAFSAIASGAQKLNLEHAVIPRWRTYSNETYIQHGMTRQVWQPLVDDGKVQVITKSEVVNIKSNRDSVEVTFIMNGLTKAVTCAKEVVVAAGPLSSPALLAKSGLIKWSDTSLSWHPMLRTITDGPEYTLGAQDVDPYQAWTSDRRLKFGSAVSTPGLLAVSLQRKVSSEEARGLRSFYASFVSSGSGGLIPGTKRPWYRYSPEDKLAIHESSKKLNELLQKSGLVNKFVQTTNKPSTVHIFGSLPPKSNIFQAGSPRLKNYPNIMVLDSSLLPLGPGVNPQGPTMVLTAVLAKRASI